MSTQKYYNEFYQKNNWKYIRSLTRAKLKSYFKILYTVFPDTSIKTVLDAGCGKGELTLILASLGYSVKGFDFSKEAIKDAKRNIGNIEFSQMDGNNLTYEGKFDLIFAKGFSPFNTRDFDNSHKILEHWRTFLNPGGIILIITRSNLSGRSPTGWIYLNKEELGQLYGEGSFKKEIIFLFSPFWIKIRAFPRSILLVRITSKISEKIIAGIFRIPVTVLIILKK